MGLGGIYYWGVLIGREVTQRPDMLLIMMQTDKTDRSIKTSSYSKSHRCSVVLSLDTAQVVSNAQDPRNFTVIGEQVHYNLTSEEEADEWRLVLQKAIINSASHCGARGEGV